MYARTFIIYITKGNKLMKQQVNLEIMHFVETQILPKYTAFGESHGLRHVTRVIKNSLKLVPVTGADIDMVYVIAAYHDLGMSGPRAIHHITSGKILQADARLKRWFTPEQIKIMKEAVEDHRASSSRQPRSIYGKTSKYTRFSCVPSKTTWRTILRKAGRNSGNDSPNTCKRNTPATDTSSFGFLTRPTRKLSMS